jgi:hypothetical protein
MDRVAIPHNYFQRVENGVDETRRRLESDPAFRASFEPLPRSLDKVVEYAQAILAGTLLFSDLDQSDKRLLINVQDHVAILGQGTITNRANERLGRSDSGVALLRRIWARELQALAEGRPTKPWRHPATGLMPKTGAVKAAE